MGVHVQTRYQQVYTSAFSDVAVTILVDVTPAFTVGYGTIRRGYADQEDFKWTGVAGLSLTGCLRGLSPTALTDTEVIGLKKNHDLNAPGTVNTIEGTTLHYIINNKPNKDDTETITGLWSYTNGFQTPYVKDTNGAIIHTYTPVASAVNYLVTKNAIASGNVIQTVAGADANINFEVQGKGTGVFIIPDGSTTKTNATPTSDTMIVNKKYVDDVAAAGANATESIRGSVQLSTVAQQGTATELGSSGSHLVPQNKNLVKTHAIYTPAFLTGDTGAESVYSNWLAVLAGSFRGTFDGVTVNVDGINFTGVTSMPDVAAKIQVAIRAATGGLETCVWSTNRLIITSGDTTSSSAITVLTTSTGTVGTDISGAGASDWMDCDTGNGVVTNAVLNPAADENKIPLLGADGNVSADFLGLALLKASLLAKGDIISASAASTPAILSIGLNGQYPIADSTATTGQRWVNTFTVNASEAETDYFTIEVPRISAGDDTPWTVSGNAALVYNGQGVNVNNTGINAHPKAYLTQNLLSIRTGATLAFGASTILRLNFAAISKVGGGVGANFRSSFIGFSVTPTTVMGDITTTTDKRVGFAFYNGNLYAVACNGSAITANLIGAYAAAAIKHLNIVLSGTTSFTPYVNGVAQTAISTNLPSSGSITISAVGDTGLTNSDAGFDFVSNFIFSEKLS